MAFTFRTAEENFIAALPAKVSDTFYSDYYEDNKNEILYLNNIFPFALSAAGKEYIAERGIRVSPFPSQTHPHPISKIFENHFIYNVLPRFIHRNYRLAVFSMKRSKAEYLYFRAKDFDLDLINRFVTAQDCGRYCPSDVVASGSYSFDTFVHNLVPRFNKAVPDVLFFHDELMHWSLSDFCYFLARIKPSTIAFTFVYPIEVLAGIPKSCNSLAYTFEVLDGDLYVFPDGSKQNPYQHSKSLSWPFNLNEIIIKSNGTEQRYSLDLIESHGAHHFFVLTAGSRVAQKTRFFSDFDCTYFDDFKIDSKKPNFIGVARTKVIAKVFNYLICLKKKDTESALAKLRQLTEGKLLSDELKIVHDLSEILCKYNLSMDSPSLLDWLNFKKIRDNLNLQSPLIDFIFGSNSSEIKRRLRVLSTQLVPFSYKIPCKSFTADFDRYNGKMKGMGPKALYNNLSSLLGSAPKLDGARDTLIPVCRLSTDSDFDASSNSCSDDEQTDEDDSTEEQLNVDAIDRASVGDKQVTPEEEASISDIHETKILDEAITPGELSNEFKLWLSSRKNGCFITAICQTVNRDPFKMLSDLMDSDSGCDIDDVKLKLSEDLPLTLNEMTKACVTLNLRVWIYMFDDIIKLNDKPDLRPIQIGGKEGHVFKLNNLSFFRCIGLLERAYIELFGQVASVTRYYPNLRKAKALLNSLRTMSTGALIDMKKVNDGLILGKERMNKLLRDQLLSEAQTPVNIVPFLGFAGSGKTRSLFNLINSSVSVLPFIWISPRRKVLDELVGKIEQTYGSGINASFKKNFVTFEVALLKKELPSLIIIDESPLLPPGYLDLLMLKDGINENTSIALIGDVLQCQFFSHDSILMSKGKVDLFDVLSIRAEQGLRTDYLFHTHRFGNNPILNFVPNSGKEFNLLRLKEASSDSEAILVASEKNKRSLGGDTDCRVMTIGESQGCNFKICSLVLTNDLNLSDIGTIITGLSRASETLEIVVNPIEAEFFLSYKRGANNCCFIMTQNAVQIQNLCKPLLGGLTMQTMIKAGADFEEKLSGDPFLKAQLRMLSGIHVPSELVDDDPVDLEQLPKTHLPLIESNCLEIDCFTKMRARDFRELSVYGAGWSSQFDDTLIPKTTQRLGPAFNPQCIFPRHKADDSITFWAAVKKRLFFSNPGTQLRLFNENRENGREILKIFLKHVPIDPTVSPMDYENALSEFEEKKISKSAAMIANHAIRSDTDWPERSIFLFMKSQLCKKKEKMFCDAKAGQTLACFSHLILVKFSGICRYIEKKVSASLPSNFYIHQKKDFTELENFVKLNDFTGFCTESDYEAFDSSQDHIALCFEVALMEYLLISREVIEDYIFIKTHLYCKLGEFAIMRFTGEFCTFLFNTLVNMAFTFMKYKVNHVTSICFAGDDMCANRRLQEETSHKHLLELMSLKAKVDFTSSPTFCGWQLSRYGIVKSPVLMSARLAVAIYKGELDLVIDSYFLEFAFAYKKKDALLDILSERDLDHHYLLTRFFVKHANRLKGYARDEILRTVEYNKVFFGEGFGNESFKSISNNVINSMHSNFWNHKLELNKELACQSSMLKNLLNSQVGQIRKSLLMGLTKEKFTVMLGPSNPNLLISLSDSKSISRCQSPQIQGWSTLMHHSLIQLKQNRCRNYQMSTAYCTSQLYSSQSLDYSHRLNPSKEKCSCLMREGLGCAQRLKMGLSLICRKQVELITYTALTTWSQLRILVFIRASSFVSNSLGCILMKVQMLSILTSGSCTGYLTTQMKKWLELRLKKPNFKNYRLAINSQICRIKSVLMSSRFLRTTHLRTLGISKLYHIGGTFWEGIKGRSLECAGITLNLFQTSLSSANSKLITIWTSSLGQILCKLTRLIHQKFLPDYFKSISDNSKMSAQHILIEQIRSELKAYLWINIVDPLNLHGLTPVQGAQLTPEQIDRKNVILDHYLRNLFGNIAVTGASDKVTFLNMEIRLTPIPAARLNLQEPLQINHVLSESVGAVKAWRDNHQSASIRSLTLRAVCRPFANNAMDFLLENPDVRTNLFYSQPHNYARAPEVAFDFADGLSRNRLDNNRDRLFVLSALASRTFNHEAKKGVFEAQGSVNFTFDG